MASAIRLPSPVLPTIQRQLIAATLGWSSHLRPWPISNSGSNSGSNSSRHVAVPAMTTRHLGTTAGAAEDMAATPESSTPELPSRQRRDRIRDARPLSDFLTDTFDRQHDYLRISVAERCNLRCVYCMPEEGVELSPDRELLTTPEIVMLSSVFVSQGVSKIRLTGGEPTVRRDIVPLMQELGRLRPHGLREICLTTNGIALHRKLDSMVEAGLTGVNLSLDTLDPFQFQIMTRRKGFDAVQRSINRILDMNRTGAGIKLKINCVVMRGVNDREVLPFVELTRHKDLEVRFIEYMPFDGNRWSRRKMFSYDEMLDLIHREYPGLVDKVADKPNDTSKTWRIRGYAGRVGFVTSMTHNFCGTCNRLRLTGDGNLKVCLFGNAEVSLRDILRQSNGGEPIDRQAYDAIKKAAMERLDTAAVDGDSLSLDLPPNEAELLDVIGMAVKRKKAKHAGMGELEHMKNRPMILIDPIRPSLTGGMPPRVRRLLNTTTATVLLQQQRRLFSSSPRRAQESDRDNDSSGSSEPGQGRLTHVSDRGTAHMVSISEKAVTQRTATAACTVRFSVATVVNLIQDNQMKKGDVLAVARVAGIMAAKRTPDLVPLCHPLPLSHVAIDLEPRDGSSVSSSASNDGAGAGVIEIRATVTCSGKTGVEMEALTAASVASLTIYDMCKAVDKGMVIEGLRVVLKDGGKSGRWEMD